MNRTVKETPPAYLRLYQALREEICRGDRRLGDRLPSRRYLARDYGLSVVTVEHSLELLVQEGYVESRPRSGFYVVYRESDGFASPPGPAGSPAGRPESSPPLRSDPEPPSDPFPFSVLAHTMRKVLTEQGERILSRTPNRGSAALREAISRYLGRNRGIRAAADQIIIGSGAEYLYGLLAEWLGRDRIFAVESPAYARIQQVYEAHGVRCDPLPLGQHGIQTSALNRTEASVLHITPFRSYPTGITASASKRQEYLRWADLKDRCIVEDDYESEFSLLRKPEETVYARASRENVIYLNTFSKTVSPAFRVAYMVLPRRMLRSFEERVGFYSCTVPTFEQLVLAELLDSGDFERHINRVRRARRKQEDGPRQDMPPVPAEDPE